MAELSPQEFADLIEAAKSRDERLCLIDQHFAVKAELRDSMTWSFLQVRSAREQLNIATALANVRATDVSAIVELQSRAKGLAYIGQFIAELESDSKTLEEEIRIEDGRAPADG